MPQVTIRRMRCAYWIIKATNTHTHAEYVLHHWTRSCKSWYRDRSKVPIQVYIPSVLISIQVFLTILASSSTVLRHVFIVLLLPRLPWGFHSRACLAISSDGFRSVWPSHSHLRFLICKSILGCFVHFQNSLFLIWSGQKILNIFQRHLLIKTCSLAVIHFEFLQVSQGADAIVVSAGKLRKLWDSLSELRSSLCERRLERPVLRPTLLSVKSA